MTDEVKDPEGLLRAYEKAKKDLEFLRGQIKELEGERDALSSEKAALETEFAGSTEEIGKWRDRVLKGEVTKNLEAQGIKNPERVLKYVDLEGVDLDDEKGLVGFDEKLAVVKTDFPELFDVKRRAARTSVDLHADNPTKPELTGTDAQVARLFGNK